MLASVAVLLVAAFATASAGMDKAQMDAYAVKYREAFGDLIRDDCEPVTADQKRDALKGVVECERLELTGEECRAEYDMFPEEKQISVICAGQHLIENQEEIKPILAKIMKPTE